MVYRVNNRVFEDARECADWVVDYCTDEDELEEYLNECYDDANVCGYTFRAGTALRELDSYAFGEELDNYRDSRAEDLTYALEHLDDGETADCYGSCGSRTITAEDELADDGEDNDGVEDDENTTPDPDDTERAGYVARMHTARGPCDFWFDTAEEAAAFVAEYKAIDPVAYAFVAATGESVA